VIGAGFLKIVVIDFCDVRVFNFGIFRFPNFWMFAIGDFIVSNIHELSDRSISPSEDRGRRGRKRSAPSAAYFYGVGARAARRGHSL
jgi:hypothetical protein